LAAANELEKAASNILLRYPPGHDLRRH
jgi:hypothetical protein